MLAAPLLAEEAEKVTGIGALGVDLTSLIAYLVNFGLLLVILYFFGYKRLLAALDQRSQRIKESLEQADRVRQESQQRQAEMQRALDASRQEGQKLLIQAQEAAARYREEQAAQARAEAERFKAEARDEIRQERDAAIEQVRGQFATLAMTAAERIVRRSLDERTHRELIEQVLTESGGLTERGGP